MERDKIHLVEQSSGLLVRPMLQGPCQRSGLFLICSAGVFVFDVHPTKSGYPLSFVPTAMKLALVDPSQLNFGVSPFLRTCCLVYPCCFPRQSTPVVKSSREVPSRCSYAGPVAVAAWSSAQSHPCQAPTLRQTVLPPLTAFKSAPFDSHIP